MTAEIQPWQLQGQEPLPCPLCERPNHFPSDHHFVPKSRGGRATRTICWSCHEAIHQTFSNKELEREYSTVEALLEHPTFGKTIAFIRKQDPTRKVKTHRTNLQKGRRRNG